MPRDVGDARASAEVTHLFQNRFKVGEAHGGAVALMHTPCSGSSNLHPDHFR